MCNSFNNINNFYIILYINGKYNIKKFHIYTSFFDPYLQIDGQPLHNEEKIYSDIIALGFKDKMISRKNPTKNLVIVDIFDIISGKASLSINFDENDYFFSNGWGGTEKHPGHAISTYIEYDSDTNHVNIIFSNSGLGVDYHWSDESGTNYNVIKYVSTIQKAFKLIKFFIFMYPIININESNITKRMKPNEDETETNFYFYYNNVIKEFISNKKYDKVYYDTVYNLLGSKDSQIGLDKGYKQMMGSCAFWAPFSLFKYLFGSNFENFNIAYKTKQINDFKIEFNDINKFNKSPKEYYYSAYLLAKDNVFEGKPELEQSLVEKINVLNTVDNIDFCPKDNTIKFDLDFLNKTSKLYDDFIVELNKDFNNFDNIIYSTLINIFNLPENAEYLTENDMDLPNWYLIIIVKIIREGFEKYYKSIESNSLPIMIEGDNYNDFYAKYNNIILKLYQYFKDEDKFSVYTKQIIINNVVAQFLIKINTLNEEYDSSIIGTVQKYDENINEIIKDMLGHNIILEEYNLYKFFTHYLKFKNILFKDNDDYLVFCNIPVEENKVSEYYNILKINIDNYNDEQDDLDIKTKIVRDNFAVIEETDDIFWSIVHFKIDDFVNCINNKKMIINNDSIINNLRIIGNINNYVPKRYNKDLINYNINNNNQFNISILMHTNYNFDKYLYDVFSKLNIDSFIESLSHVDNFNDNLLEIILYLVMKLNKLSLLTQKNKENIISKLDELNLKHAYVYQYLLEDYSNIKFDLTYNEHLESQNKLIFTTAINSILNLVNLPNYSFISDIEFYKKSSFCYYCYTKNEETFYRINNHLFKINVDIESGKIYQKINLISYEYLNNLSLLLELMKGSKNNFYILLQKLNLCLKDLSYSVWFNKDTTTKNYIIQIIYKDEIIYFEIKNNIGTDIYNIKLNYNNMIFDVVDSDGVLPLFWTLFMNNGILVKKDNNLFIFMIMDKEYINHSLFEHKMQWTKKNEVMIYWGYTLNENNFHLIKFNSSKLNFQFTNSNDFCALFLSLILSHNIVAISLLRSRILTELHNNNSIYKNQMAYILIHAKKINIPFWFMVLNDQLNNPQRLEYTKFKSINLQPETSFDLSEINQINFIKLINLVSNKIQKYKFKFDESSLSCKLKKFLQRFREKCGKILKDDRSGEEEINLQEIYCEINKKQSYVTDDISINILKDLILVDYDRKALEILPNIYLKYYQHFYKKLIYKLYLDIYEKIKKLDQRNLSCALILQTIELLDINLIYSFDKERTATDILFELQSEIFIREEQKAKLKLLLESIKNKDNYAYEILMGKGKTTTMTPYLLIQNFIQQNNKLGIVLPSHLVESSYNIMTKYCEIFTNTIISKVINSSFYNYYNNTINILSDSVFKEIILKLRIKNDDQNIQKINKTFYVYDEIDTLINPLKSDLNIPNDDNKFIHPFFDDIINILFYVSKLDYNKLLFGFEVNKLRITSTSNPDLMIKEFELSDMDFTKTICNKLNNMKKIVQSMQYNKNFGFSKIDNKQNKKLNYIAIPYIANDYPSEGSEFSDFELSIYLTIKAYQNRFLNNDNLFELFGFLNKDEFEIIKLTQSELIQVMVRILENEKTLKEIIESSETESKFKFCFKKYIDTDIFKNDFIIDFYVKHFVFEKYFKLFETQHNISFVDLFDKNLVERKISFSGTVNFNLPTDILNNLKPDSGKQTKSGKSYRTMIQNYDDAIDSQLNKIEIDEFYQGEIESAIKSSTQNDKSTNIYYEDLENNEQNLIDYLKTHLINDENGKLKYNALIDVGGIILKNKPLDVIKVIYQLTKDYGVNLLYVNDNGQKMIYDENQSKIYSEEVFQNVFIYYDNKNCVGMDFKQPFSMHGLVVLNNNNTLTEVSQGIYRLRKINIGHTIDYYLPETFRGVELYDKLNEIEEHTKASTISRSNIQCLKYLLRKNNNYINTSYNEQVFYDTIMYDSEFLTEKKFIENFFKSSRIKHKEFEINQTINLQTQLVQQMQTQVQTQVQTQTKTVVLSNLYGKYGDLFTFDKEEKKYISYDELININVQNNFKIKEIDANKIFTIGTFKVVLSPFLHGILCNIINNEYNKAMDGLFDNFYFLINDKAKNKVLVVFVAEFLLIKNYIENNKSKFSSNNIILCDQFGNVIFNNQSEITKNNGEILNLINTFMFKSKLSINDRIKYIEYYKFNANKLSDDSRRNKQIKLRVEFFMDILNVINKKIDFKDSIELKKLNSTDEDRKLKYCIEKFKISSNENLDKISSFINQIKEIISPESSALQESSSSSKPSEAHTSQSSEISSSASGSVPTHAETSRGKKKKSKTKKGGSDSEFFEKYIKYKTKYLHLKKILSSKN